MKTKLLLLATLLAICITPNLQAQRAAGGSGSRGGGAGTAASAQRASRQSGNTARQQLNQNQGEDGYIANIDEPFYVELGASYIKPGGVDVGRFTGGSLALGWQISELDKLQLEIGYYASSDISRPYNYTKDFTYNGTAYALDANTGLIVLDENGQPMIGPAINAPDTMAFTGHKNAGKITAIPVLLSFSAILKVPSLQWLNFRLTPTAGIINMRSGAWDVQATGTYMTPSGLGINIRTASMSGTRLIVSPDGTMVTAPDAHYSGGGQSRTVFALGGGFGATIKITQRLYLDLGYRYLWTVKAKNNPANGSPWDSVTAWNGMNTHEYTAALGWKF